MSEDETELAPSESATEHAHAWSLDNWAENTVPDLDVRQRTTVWLRVCAALTAASVAALIGVLLYVIHSRSTTMASVPEAETSTQAVSAPVGQTATMPVAAPTVTETKTVPVAPAPAPSQASSQTFVKCGDGREGVVGGHTSCLSATRCVGGDNDSAEVVIR